MAATELEGCGFPSKNNTFYFYTAALVREVCHNESDKQTNLVPHRPTN